MPRLGSNFFDAYNGQIDRLRTRRKENVDAFNSFVKMRKEMGETASVDDMEKYRNQLGGGDSYFMSALPTSEMLAETQKRLVANQADLIQTERQNALQTTDDELALTEKIVGGLVNIDISTPEGKKTLSEAFTTAGKPKLGEQYADLIPNMHQNARLTATKNFADGIGFEQFTTEEAIQNALSQANPWMQSQLRIRGNNQISLANTQKINDAKTSVTANFGEIINDAGGDIESMKKAVKAELKLKLGPLYTDAILEELMGAAEGQMGMDTSRRRVDALAKVNATDEELLAAGTNAAQLRILAKNSLVENGFPNPSEADIDQAVETLRGQVVTARTKDYNAKVEDAVTQAEALTDRMLEQINGDDDIDDQVETILKGQFGDDAYNNLSESQKARAIARVRAIVANNSRLANDADQEEGEEAVNSAILIDKELKRISEMGPSKDKMQSIYARINTMRATKGLPSLDVAEIKEQYGGQITALFNTGAATRYEKEIQTATTNATANVEAITSNHRTQMENIASTLPEEWATVSEVLSINFIPRSSAGYAAYQTAILKLKEKAAPSTPQEAFMMANKIANSLGWLPAANAKQILIAEELAEKDLIRPDTPVEEFLKSEEALVMADIEGVVSTINLLPIDSTQAAQQARDKAEEFIDEWERGLIMDMNSTSIEPLLKGLDGTTHVTHNNTVREIADAMRAKIIQAQNEGQYSFMFHSKGPNGGFYVISQDENRELVEANGFEVGATYRKLPDGTYEKILNPVVTADGVAPIPTESLSPTDTSQSQVRNTVRQVLSDADFQAALPNAAVRVNTGADGGAAGSLLARGFNAIFGSVEEGQKLRIRASLGNWLQSEEARNALYQSANPQESVALLKENPTQWALQNGWGGQ